jgi:hypothetical protein
VREHIEKKGININDYQKEHEHDKQLENNSQGMRRYTDTSWVQSHDYNVVNG